MSCVSVTPSVCACVAAVSLSVGDLMSPCLFSVVSGCFASEVGESVRDGLCGEGAADGAAEVPGECGGVCLSPSALCDVEFTSS